MNYADKTEISPAARYALLNAGTNRQGATVSPRIPAHIQDELRALGYIGKGNGLTRRGTIKRQMIAEYEMDRLFS